MQTQQNGRFAPNSKTCLGTSRDVADNSVILLLRWGRGGRRRRRRGGAGRGSARRRGRRRRRGRGGGGGRGGKISIPISAVAHITLHVHILRQHRSHTRSCSIVLCVSRATTHMATATRCTFLMPSLLITTFSSIPLRPLLPPTRGGSTSCCAITTAAATTTP